MSEIKSSGRPSMSAETSRLVHSDHVWSSEQLHPGGLGSEDKNNLQPGTAGERHLVAGEEQEAFPKLTGMLLLELPENHEGRSHCPVLTLFNG